MQPVVFIDVDLAAVLEDDAHARLPDGPLADLMRDLGNALGYDGPQPVITLRPLSREAV
jgi:hypothetical protein